MLENARTIERLLIYWLFLVLFYEWSRRKHTYYSCSSEARRLFAT